MIYQTLNLKQARFADNIILAAGDEASGKLQVIKIKISDWTGKWKIKLNETRSVHVHYTNRKEQYIPVRINNTQTPYANEAKYLGIMLDINSRLEETRRA